jgi:uncharacterized Zn finger protein
MFKFTADHIESIACNSSITYGKSYYDNGNVKNVKIFNGKYIKATVTGLKKYKVFLEIENGVDKSHCTCAYDRDNFCKHKVAVLLALMEHDNSVNNVELNLLQEKYFHISRKIKSLFHRN